MASIPVHCYHCLATPSRDTVASLVHLVIIFFWYFLLHCSLRGLCKSLLRPWLQVLCITPCDKITLSCLVLELVAGSQKFLDCLPWSALRYFLTKLFVTADGRPFYCSISKHALALLGPCAASSLWFQASYPASLGSVSVGPNL